jgi:hypothetical protein
MEKVLTEEERQVNIWDSDFRAVGDGTLSVLGTFKPHKHWSYPTGLCPTTPKYL